MVKKDIGNCTMLSSQINLLECKETPNLAVRFVCYFIDLIQFPIVTFDLSVTFYDRWRMHNMRRLSCLLILSSSFLEFMILRHLLFVTLINIFQINWRDIDSGEPLTVVLIQDYLNYKSANTVFFTKNVTFDWLEIPTTI